MKNDFCSARVWARALAERALYDGAQAIDATAGNGYDTLWLCEGVGAKGHVTAFDIQPEALAAVRDRIAWAGRLDRVDLVLCGHEHMAEHVKGPVDVIVFNLGWRPGGDHSITTLAKTTLPAVQSACTLLSEDGLLTICLYPGHEEGNRERDELEAWASQLDRRSYDVMCQKFLNAPPNAPSMIAIHKLAKR